MKQYLFLIAALTLFLSCKSRKVLIAKTDSIAKYSAEKSTHSEENHIDIIDIENQKNTVAYDSSGVKIVIIPVSGKQIKIDKDGNFAGEALKVEVINKKQISIKQTEFANVDRTINDQKITDNSFKKKQQVAVSKKIKSIESKPNCSWIWWISGLFILVVFVYILYKIYNLNPFFKGLFQ